MVATFVFSSPLPSALTPEIEVDPRPGTPALGASQYPASRN